MATKPTPAESIYNDFLSRVLPMIKASTLTARYAANRSLLTHPNPLTNFGGKVFSQSDEDGITFEILRRLRTGRGVFAEFGVGNGLENNTLALVAAGWGGFWVGGEEIALNPNPHNVSALNFHFRKIWINRANIVDLYRSGLNEIRRSQCDVISLDLDGNDYFFVEMLLSAGALPKLFIVEYNAKFMPPIQFKIDYDDSHQWEGDDYFGASLCSYADLFKMHGYSLVCCSLSGANAFFVRNEYMDLFADVPKEIEQIYSAPKYFLIGLDSCGHPTSLKTIESMFAAVNSGA